MVGRRVKRKISATIRGQRLYDPSVFLSAKRIDIAAKTIFARAYLEKNTSKWPEYVYREHIRAFNNFYEEEPRKNNYKDFKDSFIKTIESVRESDNWKHAAPIDLNDKHLVNGAHRVAASIAQGDKINAVQKKDIKVQNWGFSFLTSNRGDIFGIDQDVLDYMTIEYVSLKKKDVFAAIVFPAAEGYRNDAYTHLSKLGEIVNMKSFKHDEFIGKEVIKQVYFNSKNDEWNHGLDFSGAENKAELCFNGVGDLQVYIIEANLDETTRIKEKQYLRSLWGKGKHSIHITDTIEEANRVVRMFFNANSRRFMRIDREQEFASEKMYDMFNEYIAHAPVDIFERENIAIEGSAVLDLFNIRAGRDIDYISRDDNIAFRTDNIERHGKEENRYHSADIDEILTNPKYYFYYKGYKFVDILELHEYKKNRTILQDVKDVKDLNRFFSKHQQAFNSGSDDPEQPLVSVIIPVYNVEKYLNACVSSVVEQSYDNIEIILVDDKSPDKSGNICDEWALRDVRIKVIHKANNEGLNRARFTGFNLSCGDYITFLDSDDLFRKDCIEESLKYIKKYKADTVVYSHHEFSRDSECEKFRKEARAEARELTIKQQVAEYAMLGERGFPSTHHMTVWGKLYSRSVVEKVDWKISNYRAYEDNFWTPQAILNSSKVVLISDNLIYYRKSHHSRDVLSKQLINNTKDGKPVGYLELIYKMDDYYKKLIDDYNIEGLDKRLDDIIYNNKIYRLTNLISAGLLGSENNLDYVDDIWENHQMRDEEFSREYNKININNIEMRAIIETLARPGVKLATRKLLGAIRRKMRRIVKI